MDHGQRSLSERLYQALLVAYPREFRRQYSEQLVQAFGDLYREELEFRGRRGLLLLWLRTIGDLVLGVFSARSGILVPSFSLIRTGGLAVLVGGILHFISWYLFFSNPSTRALPSGQPLMDRLVLLPGPLALLLIAVGLVALGDSIRRVVAQSSKWAKFISVVGIASATISFATSAVWIAIELVTGSFYVGGPGGVTADAIQVIALNISGMLAHWSLAFAGLAIGGALLMTRVLGRWWVLLPIVGLFTVPQAIGLLRVATLGPFLLLGEANSSLNSSFTVALLLVPNVLVALGWIVFGFVLLSGRGERLEGLAPVS